jgi:hypothetical protein
MTPSYISLIQAWRSLRAWQQSMALNEPSSLGRLTAAAPSVGPESCGPLTVHGWCLLPRGVHLADAYFTDTGVYRSRDGARATGPFVARSNDDGQTFPMRSLVGYDRGGTDPKAPINAVPLEIFSSI